MPMIYNTLTSGVSVGFEPTTAHAATHSSPT